MTSRNTWLPHLLRLNAASCIGFGALFAGLPGPVAAFLGTMPQGLVTMIGWGLLLNGAHLLIASWRKSVVPLEVAWFSTGDLIWWLATLALLAAGLWITTPQAIGAAALVAASVAALGVAQLACLGMLKTSLDAKAHWRRVARSWLGLPRWVKLWLVALNIIFLAASLFLPWNDASIVLIAYAASGPLLVAFAAHQGGLTRQMGLGHLIPWAPLLAWCWLEATAASGSPLETAYLAALAATLAVCLAFDIWDIARWLRGEKAVIGLGG